MNDLATAYAAALADPAGDADAPDGAAVLDDVEAFLSRFVAFPSAAAGVAVTLWTAHAHLIDSAESSPRLALLSPEPSCGKTRVLEVLDLLVPEPLHALSASPAAIFRTLAVERPSLLFDEVDAIFGRRSDDGAEDLRSLLNAGHRRGASIPRCVGPNHDVKRFPVFAAVGLAGLGDLPDTIMARAIIVRMRRRAPHERVEPFRRREQAAAGAQLRGRLAEWAAGVADEVAEAWPDMPAGVEDRPADVWESPLAIADAAGGTWPERARTACVALCKVAESREASLGLRLLADLRAIFGDADALHSEVILDRLHALAESPWGDLRGKPLDARGLARRLRQYEIRSLKVKVEGKSLQGYRREHLWDAWTRYLSPTPQEGEPPEPAEPGRSEAPSPVPDAGEVPEPPPEAEPDTPPLTCDVPEVPQVPDSGGRGPAGSPPSPTGGHGSTPPGKPPAAPAADAVPILSDVSALPAADRPSWTPTREPVGPCRDCDEPAFTWDETGRPCHLGCNLPAELAARMPGRRRDDDDDEEPPS